VLLALQHLQTAAVVAVAERTLRQVLLVVQD
jgi:hypothetical protein